MRSSGLPFFSSRLNMMDDSILVSSILSRRTTIFVAVANCEVVFVRVRRPLRIQVFRYAVRHSDLWTVIDRPYSKRERWRCSRHRARGGSKAARLAERSLEGLSLKGTSKKYVWRCCWASRHFGGKASHHPG